MGITKHKIKLLTILTYMLQYIKLCNRNVQNKEPLIYLFSSQLKNAVAFSLPTSNFSSVGIDNFTRSLREK